MGLLVGIGTLSLAVVYTLMLSILWRAWLRLPPTPTLLNEEVPFVTVLIPARNEAGSIVSCLDALLAQHYPKHRCEFIVIDDHSEDDTARLALSSGEPRVRLLSLAQHLAGRRVVAYKKEALSWGVSEARGELIVTTDADCIAPPYWLATIAAAHQSGATFITAPVCIRSEGSFLHAFQALDVAGVMILTGAALRLGHPLLANGANLAFSRKLFEKLSGYEGHTHLASGDDVLLLQKVKASNPNSGIVFLADREATVSTEASPTWPKLWQQRLRWAAKTSAYRDWRLVAFQGGVFLLCWGLLLSCWLSPTLGILALGLKILADYAYLRAASRWFGQASWMRWFWPSEVLHILYIAVVGTIALLPIQVNWKGRSSA